MVLLKEIDINFKDCKYQIYIWNNFDGISTYMDEHKIDGKVLIVTDSVVGELYENDLIRRIKRENVYIFRMHPGESSKNLSTVNDIYEKCNENNFDRSSAIIALGGGVVGDTAGFAASTFMRGIRFIQLPTTLISDIDSSVGGKVGVNFRNIKNMIGSFYHPQFVYINTSTLKTLEKRHLISGIAEVIKYAVLYDNAFFNYINENANGILNLESDKLNYIIRKCINMKIEAVRNDLFDKNEMQLLNFGHTLGHAIESMSKYSIYHGEAIALGIVFECILSYVCEMLSDNDMQEIIKLICKYDLIYYFEFSDLAKVFDIMEHDKKVDRGNMKFILPQTIGNGIVVQGIKQDKIIKAFELFKEYTKMFKNSSANKAR